MNPDTGEYRELIEGNTVRDDEVLVVTDEEKMEQLSQRVRAGRLVEAQRSLVKRDREKKPVEATRTKRPKRVLVATKNRKRKKHGRP